MSSSTPSHPAARPWWTRSSSKNSDISLQSSSSTKPTTTLKSARSFTSLKRDDSAAVRRPESQKSSRRSSPSSSKFNTLASAIGLKAKKSSGPTLAIQDPPSLLADAPSVSTPPLLPSPAPSQVSHNIHTYTAQPPENSVSSPVDPSWDDAEPRTPSDVQSSRDRSSYQHSVLTLSDTDPFASRGIVVPRKVQIQDPSRLSAFSDGSNASSSELHQQKKAGPEYINRASFASASSSSQSHAVSLHQQPDEPPPGTPQSSRREGGLPNRLSEPPSDPMKPIHRPPMRARGMTDVGPRRTQSAGNGDTTSTHIKASSHHNTAKPVVVVRQASVGRLHSRPVAPPPPIPIPPTPVPVPSLSPGFRSGDISDSSTVRDPTARESAQTASSSSYHTAPEPEPRDSKSRLFPGDKLLSSTPLGHEDSDSSGSSLSFASSISETRDMVLTHGNVWSPRERDFSRHGKRNTKSIDKGKTRVTDEHDDPDWELINLRSPSKSTIVPSTCTETSPTQSLKKALSQQSMAVAMTAQRFSVASTVSASSTHSSTMDDHNVVQEKSGQNKGKGKPPKKQRSFHHSRIPLPPLPHIRPTVSNSGSLSTHNHADSTTSTITDHRKGPMPSMAFPSFPSLSISTSSSEKNLDKTNSTPAQPHTPVRKRLFSGSSLRRTPSSQAHSPSEEDTRSVFSLTLESDGRSGRLYANPLSPNESVASFWEDGEGFGGMLPPRPQGDYVPQQIMSPADMLKLEAMMQQEHDERSQYDSPQRDDRSQRDSVQSTPGVTVHAPDTEEFGPARTSLNSYMGHNESLGRPRGNSQASSMSASTTSMSLNTPSSGFTREWHPGSPSMASLPSATSSEGPGSPPSGTRFWDRILSRSGQEHASDPSQRHSSGSRAPIVSSPLSPFSQSFKPSRGSSAVSKGPGPPPLRGVRRPTSQPGASPAASPTASSFLISPAAGAPVMMHSPPNSLPPPPRRRPRTSSAVTSTSTTSSREAVVRVSNEPLGPPPPPRRPSSQRSGRSPYPPSSTRIDNTQRRTIIRKPSFLDIEDEAESPSETRAPAKPFDENFLDLGRGKDSFDTVRSMDILELVGPG